MSVAVLAHPPVAFDEAAAEDNWGTRAVQRELSKGGGSWSLPFAQTLGLADTLILVALTDGELVMQWEADPRLDSLDGIIQGGALNVIADYAQGHLFTTLLDRPQGFSTVDFQPRFLRPVHSGTSYRVVSKVVETSRRTTLIETRFLRPDGKATTYVMGTWQVSERAFEVKR